MKWLCCLVFVALAGCGRNSQPAGDALEKEFTEKMRGAALVGRSTTWNKEELSGEERYQIDKVSKIGNDLWMLQVRMRLGNREIPMPVPVAIRWAGDTPMIQLTNVAIPGTGTFTARVLLYQDQYSGVWSGGGHGGQLFGRIERPRP